MKKLLPLLLALLLALTLTLPALAEAAGDAVEAAADTAEAAADTAEAAADTAEAAADTAEAAADAAQTGEDAAEASEESAKPAVQGPSIKDLLELPWYTWVLLVVLVAVGIALSAGAKKTKWDSHMIAMGAMCIAIGFVLSCIRLFRMPQGGSITPAEMLPLVLFTFAYGPLPGLVVGCAHGLLTLISDPYVIHPLQLLVDYPLAYGMAALAWLATKVPVEKRWQLPIGALLAGIGRYLMAVLSGAVFFAEYAGEQNAWIYSLVYNLSYIGPNVIVCMLVACIPGMDRLVKVIRGKR